MGGWSVEDLEARYRGAEIIICGNGPSAMRADLSEVGRPVWTINGGWNFHPETELGWVMDDIHGPALRIDSNTNRYFPDHAKQMEEIRGLDFPVITSTAYEGYPCLVEYPLRRVLEFFWPGKRKVSPYFNETINYMIAWAIVVGVKRLDFIGVDYINVRPDERASTEFWAGQAAARGIAIGTSDYSHFLKMQELDGINRHIPGVYGYREENFPLEYRLRPNGRSEVSL